MPHFLPAVLNGLLGESGGGGPGGGPGAAAEAAAAALAAIVVELLDDRRGVVLDLDRVRRRLPKRYWAQLSGDPRDPNERLWELADDLDRLRQGEAPSAEELLDAPLLHDWTTVPDPTVALCGFVEGHPTLRDGRPIMTSAVYASDPHGTWVRTLSRWYRLGRRAGERGV